MYESLHKSSSVPGEILCQYQRNRYCRNHQILDQKETNMWHPHRKHSPPHQRKHLFKYEKKALRDVSSIQHANTHTLLKTIHPDFKLCFRKNVIQTPKLLRSKISPQKISHNHQRRLHLHPKTYHQFGNRGKMTHTITPKNPTNEEMR